MAEAGNMELLVARCIVCKGNVHAGDQFTIWEDAYYCERHSLPRLRERAQEYARLLQEQRSEGRAG